MTLGCINACVIRLKKNGLIQICSAEPASQCNPHKLKLAARIHVWYKKQENFSPILNQTNPSQAEEYLKSANASHLLRNNWGVSHRGQKKSLPKFPL